MRPLSSIVASRDYASMKPTRRPGDLLLDRYFKDADEATRERAREAFLEFAHALERIGEAVLRERADSHESDSCGTIPSTPTVDL